MSITDDSTWLMLTPSGTLQAFASPEPDAHQLALQHLLTGLQSLSRSEWLGSSEVAQASWLEHAVSRGWVQLLPRPLKGPNTQLDNFVQHIIASFSSERRALLASDSGFCLGRSKMAQEEADALAVVAADFSSFLERQVRRGWNGARRFISFHADPQMLLPDVSFVPFWVDGSGYWIVINGEPMLNNTALVELMWGLKAADNRFNFGG